MTILLKNVFEIKKNINKDISKVKKRDGGGGGGLMKEKGNKKERETICLIL